MIKNLLADSPTERPSTEFRAQNSRLPLLSLLIIMCHICDVKNSRSLFPCVFPLVSPLFPLSKNAHSLAFKFIQIITFSFFFPLLLLSKRVFFSFSSSFSFEKMHITLLLNLHEISSFPSHVVNTTDFLV
jgi:hypothetical protein